MRVCLKPTVAGAVAATIWGALEPLDQRVFRWSYSDVAVLGKAFTRGPGWRPLGFGLHAVNGAIFGLVFDKARRHTNVDGRRLALGLALVEHMTLYPLGHLVNRYHPARGGAGRGPLGLVRHALFGLLLGRLAED